MGCVKLCIANLTSSVLVPQSISETADTVVEDVNVEIDLDSSVALYRERMAIRRYTEEKRVVIVWREFSDALRIVDEPTEGVRFLERGYVVIREDVGNGKSCIHRAMSSPRIVLQICYLTAPLSNGNLAEASSSKIGTITDFVVAATAANMSASFEIIESVLVDQAIKVKWSEQRTP